MLNSFIAFIKSQLRLRTSGEMLKQIKSIESCIEKIDKGPYDFSSRWLSWYRDYLKAEVQGQKLKFFVPASLLPAPIRWKSRISGLRKLMGAENITLKDILLPLPHAHMLKSKLRYKEHSLYMLMVIDSLLTYLLEDCEDEFVYSIIPSTCEGPYEYKNIRLERGDIVIDAGANIGEFLALAGVKGCEVYAFEPIPYIIDNYLSKVAEWNPGISICPFALSNKQGEAIFQTINTFSVSSSLIRKSKGDVMSFMAKATDLDTFTHENNLASVDFIKADIEGAERHMLMGAKGVLKEFAPKIAICTYHLPDDPEVLRELILDANPDYIIEERFKKMYAYVSKLA